MLKGVGWYALFIIVSIALFFSATLVVLWKYLEFQTGEATKEACANKLQNYCYTWLVEKKEPGNWNEIHPKSGCEKFGINKPSLDDCKKVTGL